MAIILFDDQSRESLFPLTFTRPVADLRIGILTISKKWEHYLHQGASYLTEDYLQVKYPTITEAHNIFINASVLPNQFLLDAIDALKEAELLVKDDAILAIKLGEADAKAFNLKDLGKYAKINFEGTFTKLVYPEDIFKYNDQEIRIDFELLTKNRTSATLSSTNTIIGEHIFVEEGVEAECSSFNTKAGPIYLGKNTQVWEGSHIRGSFALCHDSQVKMGAKIYGASTIGPDSRVGGEINNAVIWGHSSKGHDGYLGNAVLGEWCNIGADSNNSNLKNNYDEVKLWDYRNQRFRKTGLQFCGLIMADHAKCGINTMFNTGTVVGVSANLFGAGFPRNFVPDFAWGGSHGFEVYQLEKMFKTAGEVYKRRNSVFNDVEKDILTHIFNNTEVYRRF